MPETMRRQLIVNKLVTKAATIRVANGFYTDIGQKVDVDRQRSYFKEDEQAINILDDPDESDLSAEDESLEDHDLDVALEIFIKSGDPATIRKAIQDVRTMFKQLRDDDPGWMKGPTALVRAVRPAGNNKDYDELKTEKLAGATVRFTIEYQTLAFEEA